MNTPAATIEADTVVTIRYRIDDANGRPMQDKADEVAYLHGGYDNLLPAIEAGLQGRQAGYSTTIDLTPEHGFGVRDESLVRTVARSDIPPGAKVGSHLELADSESSDKQLFRIVKVKGQQVELDGNHPLAGQHVRFVVRVLDVRPATSEEIKHRHAHGEHGHQH